MEKYGKGKIYKLVCENLVYYGSTIQPLCERKSKHKQTYLMFKKGLSTKKTTAMQLYEIGDPKIYLVEDFPCERKEQLESRERWWIENNPCVNKVIPTRSAKERRNDNIDHIKAYEKEYKEKNKERIKAKYSKKYICECGKSRHEKSELHIRRLNEHSNN